MYDDLRAQIIQIDLERQAFVRIKDCPTYTRGHDLEYQRTIKTTTLNGNNSITRSNQQLEIQTFHLWSLRPPAPPPTWRQARFCLQNACLSHSPIVPNLPFHTLLNHEIVCLRLEFLGERDVLALFE